MRPVTTPLRIGTRGSQLALVQANWVAARLAEHGVATEITVIRTEGDDRPVDTAWGEGAFVGRIVGALLDGSVDLAVHSAKDVPTDEHPRLTIAAYPPREDPRDALVCRVRGTTLATLPRGARVGTDSPRRVAFLRAIRPDLQVHPLHGNVDTRLAKLDRGESDALVLAVAGLTRLGRADRIDDILPTSHVAPAPGQGSLALQVRADDDEAIAAVSLLDDAPTRAAVQAERALLNATGGGCRSPIGAAGLVDGATITLEAAAERSWVPTPDAALTSTGVVRVRGSAPVTGHRELAARLAARIVTLRARPRVLVGRQDEQAAPLLRALDAVGIDALTVPAIETVPVPAGGALDAAVAAAAAGDLIAVTSANAARGVLDAARRLAIAPARFAWAAVGDATAAILAGQGITEVFVPSAPDAATLAAELPLVPGRAILLPRTDIAGDTLPDALRARGAVVTTVVAYRTLEAPEASRPRLASALDDGPVDVLVVTSPSVARGLLALAADDAARARLLAAPVVAIGEPSADAARSLGFAPVLVAPSTDPDGLATFVATALGVALADGAVPHARTGPDPMPEPTGAAR
jgi:hydroxymethylbilane synthase